MKGPSRRIGRCCCYCKSCAYYRDTEKTHLEFNAASFSTKANATVEDLLKELPGVEVDTNAEGNITVNGKPVNKILVNGKPFFGDDPTIATRSLTKEIVEKY